MLEKPVDGFFRSPMTMEMLLSRQHARSQIYFGATFEFSTGAVAQHGLS